MGLHDGDLKKKKKNWFAITAWVNIDSGQIKIFWNTTAQQHLTQSERKSLSPNGINKMDDSRQEKDPEIDTEGVRSILFLRKTKV